MSRFGLLRSLFAFAVFIGLTLTPIPLFAQHGGGHGGGGGGGGGGFHGGGGGGYHGGGGYYGGGRSYGGGSYERGGDFRGGSAAGREGGGRGSYGGSEAGGNSGSSESHSSNLRPAIADGQWHSFGNSGSSARSSAGSSARSSAGSSARSSEGRNSGGAANSSLSARNTGIADGAWHSFGSSRGAAGFVGGASRAMPGFGRFGYGWGGGWGWGRGWGWGGWGWGGWGFGFGWPYWGGYWGLGWNPWWYDPYWYAPSVYAYPDYSYDWSDNPPPYAPDSAYNYDPSASDLSAPSSNYDAYFSLNSDASPGNSGSVQNGQTPQPEAAPNRAAAAAQP